MAAALLAARLVLAAVFAGSGLAKATDAAGTRQAVAGLGFPAWAAGAAIAGLPAVELLTAAALIPATTAVLSAWLAFGLVAAFSVVIAVSLARGRRPACHCFGQFSAAPIGPGTLARNAVLGAVAAFVGIAGWPRGGASIGGVGSAKDATAVVIGALAVALAALATLVVVLLGRYGEILRRLEQLPEAAGPYGPGLSGSHNGHSPSATGLAVGAPAPEFDLPGPGGGRLTLSGLRSAGHPVLLVFTDPQCQPCQSLLPDLARWQLEYSGWFTTALISRGTATDPLQAGQHRLRNVAVHTDQEIAASYRYAGTPSAVVVTPEGRIATSVAAGPVAIRALAAALARDVAPGGVAQPWPAAQARRGQPAPTHLLPDLDGVMTAVTARRDGPFLMLFWNPGCGFCQRALDDIRARERGPVEFVVVSAGDSAANRAMGLTSLVLLDPDFAVSRAFGASGTPSAVLVGADRVIASDLAVGAPAVLSLADDAASLGARKGAGAASTPTLQAPGAGVHGPSDRA